MGGVAWSLLSDSKDVSFESAERLRVAFGGGGGGGCVEVDACAVGGGGRGRFMSDLLCGTGGENTSCSVNAGEAGKYERRV